MEYDSFMNYHPLVNFIFFTSVIVFSMFFMHPAYQLIAYTSSLLYLIIIKGFEESKGTLLFSLFIIAMTSILNPLFSHEGVTLLFYMESGNPITLESIIYGISSGVMFATVIIWFASYNQVMTSDKFIYLFGSIIPGLSLILSMVFRFVPRYRDKIKDISMSQKAIGRDMSQGNIIRRARNGLTILSIMITWALENAIETSDSMRARGYGLPGRTSFSIYEFTKRDKIVLVTMVISILIIIVGSVFGLNAMKFYPAIEIAKINLNSIIIYIAYFVLCNLPIIINIQEEIQWKSIESRI